MTSDGAPIHAISVFLGHRDISSTEIYTKINFAEIRRAIDDIDLTGDLEET